jgi:hypothetical protein
MTFSENDIPDLKGKIIIVTGNYFRRLLITTSSLSDILAHQAEIVVLENKRSPCSHPKEQKYILQLVRLKNTTRRSMKYTSRTPSLLMAKSNFSS